MENLLTSTTQAETFYKTSSETTNGNIQRRLGLRSIIEHESKIPNPSNPSRSRVRGGQSYQTDSEAQNQSSSFNKFKRRKDKKKTMLKMYVSEERKAELLSLFATKYKTLNHCNNKNITHNLLMSLPTRGEKIFLLDYVQDQRELHRKFNENADIAKLRPFANSLMSKIRNISKNRKRHFIKEEEFNLDDSPKIMNTPEKFSMRVGKTANGFKEFVSGFHRYSIKHLKTEAPRQPIMRDELHKGTFHETGDRISIYGEPSKRDPINDELKSKIALDEINTIVDSSRRRESRSRTLYSQSSISSSVKKPIQIGDRPKKDSFFGIAVIKPNDTLNISAFAFHNKEIPSRRSGFQKASIVSRDPSRSDSIFRNDFRFNKQPSIEEVEKDILKPFPKLRDKATISFADIVKVVSKNTKSTSSNQNHLVGELINENTLTLKKKVLRLKKEKHSLKEQAKSLPNARRFNKVDRESKKLERILLKNSNFSIRHKGFIQRIHKIREAQRMTDQNVRGVVQGSILQYIIKKNDPFLYEIFLADIKKPYLSGLMEESRQAYQETIERIMKEHENKRKGRIKPKEKRRKYKDIDDISFKSFINDNYLKDISHESISSRSQLSVLNPKFMEENIKELGKDNAIENEKLPRIVRRDPNRHVIINAASRPRVSLAASPKATLNAKSHLGVEVSSKPSFSNRSFNRLSNAELLSNDGMISKNSVKLYYDSELRKVRLSYLPEGETELANLAIITSNKTEANYGFLKKTDIEFIENLPKKLRRELLVEKLGNVSKGKDLEFYFSSKHSISSDSKSLDYLYKISYEIRKKILKLDKCSKKDKAVIVLRGELLEMNFKINKKIRNICMKLLKNGHFKLDITPMITKAR